MRRDFRAKSGNFRGNRRRHPVRQILIGKVDIRLQMCEGGNQRGAPALIKPPELPLHLAQRLAGLRFCFGIDKIAEPFRRGQIHLAMLKRAAGKLPRRRRAEPVKRRQLGKQCGQDGRAAMQVKFHHIFAGKAVRPWKCDDKRLIYNGIVRCSI